MAQQPMYATADLVPLSGPARVLSATDGVKVRRRAEGKDEAALGAGGDVLPRDEVLLPPGGTLVLEFGDGKHRTIKAPADEGQSVSFFDPGELKRHP